MTATERAMASEEWAKLEQHGEPLTAAATAYWHGKVTEAEDRIRELEEELDSTVRLLDAANVDNERLYEALETIVISTAKGEVFELGVRMYVRSVQHELRGASDEEGRSA